MKDPYSVLGVRADASDEEISKAYKNLARKYHPDLHPGDKAAEQKMTEINAAYESIKAFRSGKQTYGYEDGGRSGDPGAYRYASDGQTFYGFDFDEMFRQAAEQRSQNTSERTSSGLFRAVFRFVSAFFLLRLLFSFLFRPFGI